MKVIDLVTNEKILFTLGIVLMVIIKLGLKNSTIDIVAMPFVILLMFNFMTNFIFIGIFGYKK